MQRIFWTACHEPLLYGLLCITCAVHLTFNIAIWLQKAYKQLYSKQPGAGADTGTLRHFKTILEKTYINGSVKGGRYKPHEDLLLNVSEFLTMEQVLDYCGMDSYDSPPTGTVSIPANIRYLRKETKQELADKILLGVLRKYQYCDFNINADTKCQ